MKWKQFDVISWSLCLFKSKLLYRDICPDKIDTRIVKLLWKVEGIINALRQMYKNNSKNKSGIYRVAQEQISRPLEYFWEEKISDVFKMCYAFFSLNLIRLDLVFGELNSLFRSVSYRLSRLVIELSRLYI